MRRLTSFLLQALAALGEAEYPYLARHPVLIAQPSRKAVDDAFWTIVTRQWGDEAQPGRRRPPRTPSAEM